MALEAQSAYAFPMEAMVRQLVAGKDFSVSDVRLEGDGAWSSLGPTDTIGVLFVRNGCFRRDDALLDATSVYVEPPGRSARELHRSGADDRWTSFSIAPALLAGGGGAALPAGAVFSPPFLDLEHRRLLALAYRAPDLVTRDAVTSLIAAVLDRLQIPRAVVGRATTALQRRQIVDSVRETLALDPRVRVVQLARQAAVSPHHLSRIFAHETGQTISTYRNCLRARIALERVAAGERSLARIAADLGFADHAHLTRVVRSQAGAPPSNLRELLRFGA
jgi:AraC-like DNA-binding protein